MHTVNIQIITEAAFKDPATEERPFAITIPSIHHTGLERVIVLRDMLHA